MEERVFLILLQFNEFGARAESFESQGEREAPIIVINLFHPFS
jgi:hypothetical protein